jgi:hypothetical protein
MGNEMKNTHTALAALAIFAAGAASAETYCTKIGFRPGDPDPNHCFTTEPAPTPEPTTTTSSARATSAASSTAEASNSLNVGGDSNRSLVAVFPAPSTAQVPSAHNCIATRSTAGGFGWNLIQGATSEQYSEPVCVLQWLSISATDPAERAAVRAEILKRITN